jgi:6-phosphogluconolactonase (cycloisomerase 2 family)
MFSPGAVSVVDMRVMTSPDLALTSQFSNETAGTVPDRQDGSHAHETILDPLGKYVLIPDLGADVVHILDVNPVSAASAASVSAYAPLAVPPGTGPRHGVFWFPSGQNYQQGDPLFFVLDGELSGDVLVYSVTYPEDNTSGLSFVNVNTTSAVGPNKPATNAPGEITISVSVKGVTNNHLTVTA